LSHTTPTIVKKTGQLSKANCKVDPQVLQKSQERVQELLSRFPLYPEIEI
jgi:glycine hydroxymethyltransferase